MKMLVPPEKKAKKKSKEAKGGLRHKGTSDAVSGETEIPSSHEGDEDEEEEEAESDSPLKGGGEEEGSLYRPEGGGVQEGEDDPLGWFGFRCRTHPREAFQGEAPSRIVRIKGYITSIWSFMFL